MPRHGIKSVTKENGVWCKCGAYLRNTVEANKHLDKHHG